MVTRSKDRIYKPKLYFAVITKEPKSVRATLVDPRWFAAMKEEVVALHKNHN